MIRMIPTTSAGHAKSYFTDALQPTGYYINDQELQGHFYGLAAERLGITGIADKDTFDSLCDNINPLTGKNLTPRTNEHRTIAYDISFHCPKSISVLHILNDNDHVLTAFQQSVRETMKEMESDMMTRVRRKGKDEDRRTAEMIIAEFIHQTARPADGSIADPHLHIHNMVQNVTFDPKENRFKAGQFREIARSLPYYQQRYHKRFADKLMAMGYRIRKTKSAFEIDGVPQHIIDLFSKRSNEIGQFAKDHGITDAKSLDQLGARTRGKKQKDLSMAELKTEWRNQIMEASVGKQSEGDAVIKQSGKVISPELSAQRCIDHASLHHFERLSTINERRLLETAYRQAVGNNSVTLDEITSCYTQDNRFIRIQDGHQVICTTKEVLAEEKDMVRLAQQGQGRFVPYYRVVPDILLEGQQKNAVEHVLTTSNMLSIIRGVAGAGKTTTLTELDRHLKALGKAPLYVAPTAEAVRGVLVQEGFTNADTVARLLVDKSLQEKLANQILIVDEAGLLGTSDMRNLLRLATSKKAKIVLVGDHRQHSSVVRGDALKILSTVGKIKPAEINKIRRQRNEKYRAAVQDLAEGRVGAAFSKLEDIEAIREVDPLNPNVELVADYVAATKRGKSALIVSPTHNQGQSVTADIRKALQEAGLLNSKESPALKLTNANFTEAQKRDWQNFRPGQVIQFNLPAPKIKRGSIWTISAVGENNIVMKDKNGTFQTLPTDKAKAFDVFDPGTINLAKGDKIRITKNSFDGKRKRLNNGQSLEVVSATERELKLRNRESKATYTVKPDFGHIDHAYCTTSYSSQGKTVDEIFISQPAATFVATDAKQIYVSVSRGRNMVTIYTDHKEHLLEYATRSGDRQSAMELLARVKPRPYGRPEPYKIKTPDKEINQPKEKQVAKPGKHLDYEP